MSSRKETNKLKSNRHQKDYRTDNTVKRNKIARKLYASYSFNLANYTLHTMEHKQNISLIMYRNVNSFFFYTVDVSNVFVMFNSIKLLHSGPGTHLWIPGMICTVIL